jgi:hypothetical protein
LGLETCEEGRERGVVGEIFRGYFGGGHFASPIGI